MSLGTGALKGWWVPCASMRHCREVSMVTLGGGTSPVSGYQSAPSHWGNISGYTYLTQYLPGCGFQLEWKGQGSKFASEAMEEICCDGKVKADGEQGCLVSSWQAIIICRLPSSHYNPIICGLQSSNWNFIKKGHVKIVLLQYVT